MICFLHPKGTRGVLVEFATPPPGETHHRTVRHTGALAGLALARDHRAEPRGARAPPSSSARSWASPRAGDGDARHRQRCGRGRRRAAAFRQRATRAPPDPRRRRCAPQVEAPGEGLSGLVLEVPRLGAAATALAALAPARRRRRIPSRRRPLPRRAARLPPRLTVVTPRIRRGDCVAHPASPCRPRRHRGGRGPPWMQAAATAQRLLQRPDRPRGSSPVMNPSRIARLRSAARILLAVATVLVGSRSAIGIVLPSGFEATNVFTGLTQPTAVQFASDGRVFVAEKSGLIKVFELADRPDADGLRRPPHQHPQLLGSRAARPRAASRISRRRRTSTCSTRSTRRSAARRRAGERSAATSDSCPNPPGRHDRRLRRRRPRVAPDRVGRT